MKSKLNNPKQAGPELGKAQLKLELGFTSFKICCIESIHIKTCDYFDRHQPLPAVKQLPSFTSFSGHPISLYLVNPVNQIKLIEASD